MLRLYNTLTRKKQAFRPLKGKTVTLYTCGPTVYERAHIGNLRTYIFNDVLKRVLLLAGFKVRHVMNITDVGHLTSDADTGEDKLAAAARRERKTAWEVARYYEQSFKQDVKKLNISEPAIWARATEHIQEQITLVKKLEHKGYTYLIPGDGIYFDTSHFKTYGKLMPSRLAGIRAGARIEMVVGKRHPTDFALWKFSPPRVKRDMEWSSHWGRGFPGWHLECSAMSTKYLGKTIDMHTGGVDLIPIHHTNEIAQSEAATGKPFVRFWLHVGFLKVEGSKMAKSKRNFFTLEDLAKHGLTPLDFRYFTLTAHYRRPLNFTWKSLEGARSALASLREFIQETKASARTRTPAGQWNKVKSAFFDDFNTSKALALLWMAVREARKTAVKNALSQTVALILEADKVLGLKLAEQRAPKPAIPARVRILMAQREKLRQEKRWVKADRIRLEIKKLGFAVQDTPSGPRLKRITLRLSSG